MSIRILQVVLFACMLFITATCQNGSIDHEAIYRPGRTWKYNSVFKYGDKLMLDSFIVKAEKGSIFLTQQKIKYLYKNTLPDGSIRTVEETTGVVVNKEKVWLHPPRSEHYVFTEITPFPELVFNESDWKRKISIAKHDSFSGSVESSYKFLGIRDSVINNISYDSLYCISAISFSKYGSYNAVFYFHKKMGFVHFYYLKPDGEEVFIYLNELIDEI